MNKNIYYSLLACGLLLGGLTQSCATEEPFGASGEGELRMKMVINSDVTRAETDEESLRENCVVYISGTKGLLHKYKGLENVPEQIVLKSGAYVAEAWTGDSVSASFDKKFFRGYQPFNIEPGINSVVVNCKIANVVVSINPETIDPDLMKDWTINVANSRASLDFTEENMDYAKGYFMMPNDDTELVYTISGTNNEGQKFTYTGKIENPERAHEYVLNIEYHPEFEEIGGSFVTIVIADNEVTVESEVTLFSRPAVKGVGFEIDKQIFANAGKFTDKIFKINAFGGIRSIHLESTDYAELGLPSDDLDLMNLTDVAAEAMHNSGITWDLTFNEDKNMAISYITLPATWLNNIPEREQEYQIILSVTDKYGKVTSVPVRFAVGEGAIVIDDPVTVEDIDTSNLLNIRGRRVTLNGAIVNADALNPGIRYREAGTLSWQFAGADAATLSRARRRHLSPAQALRSGGTSFSVTLTGLKPGTRYEYQAVADEFNSESKFFTTEAEFVIPNASFETWGTYSAKTMLGTKTVIFPGADRNDYFWDSGNEGAATASKVVLDKSTDMFHSGSYSARLASTSAVGVIAAGNVFTGVYVKTDGTDGVLSIGRPYNGSHPDKIAVYANYRPGGNVTVKSGNEKYVDVTSGGTDHGQIYVALTTAPIEIRTKAANRKLFPAAETNEDGKPAEDYDKVVAYGQVTWNSAFGPDGNLQRLEIPLEYRNIAKTTKPLYLVIVCSASKFGDFYCGSASSVMYVDDFELVFE
ncbi:MAG: DUF4493 domain-containing protein [Muribaculaceae bacterium]|nr:DUF4493 domain-containing protein [Muribaculaceae bacterium]